MAQESIYSLTTAWTALSDIITVDASTTYYLQNRGADILLLVESSSAPSSNSIEGVLVQPYTPISYQKGSDNLYLRALNSTCTVNVSSEG